MSLLTAIEARSAKGRLYHAAIILVLALGAVATAYPFVFMVTGALRSEMDAGGFSLVPAYVRDETELVRKFLEWKHNGSVALMNRLRQSQDDHFARAVVPEILLPTRVEDVEAFVHDTPIPNHWWVLGGTQAHRGIASPILRRLQGQIRAAYGDDLDALSAELGVPVAQWRHLQVPAPDWTSARFSPVAGPLREAVDRLLLDVPLAYRSFVTPTAAFLENMVYPRYGRAGLDPFNRDYGLSVACFSRFTLSPTVPSPDAPLLRTAWIEFVTSVLHPSYVLADAEDTWFRAFLSGRYATVEALNVAWGTPYVAMDNIRLPDGHAWLSGTMRRDYEAFLVTLPPESLRITGPEYAWQGWLQGRYPTRGALSAAYGEMVDDWAQCRIPIDHVEAAYVRGRAGSLRRALAVNHFVNVVDALVLQGRAFLNTMLLIGLALFFSLTLQPLAAYALSRFSPPDTWRIILLFMATMAFPPMVCMIPQFLLLRRLDLFNTFAALVLPMMVNGYIVFMLKIFFDAIPRQLYDAAMMDGASEWRMFWGLTMSISKPILAVVALQTFNMVWASFLYPLLVAPAESMHVIGVWLYQFQRQAAMPAVFASVLLTSIPTLLVFFFAQRIIMRGIAIPAER